jgi:hypothetical protein
VIARSASVEIFEHLSVSAVARQRMVIVVPKARAR